MKIIETDFGRVTVFPIVKSDGITYEHVQDAKNNFYPFDVMEIGDVTVVDSFMIFERMRTSANRLHSRSKDRKFKCTKSDPRHNGMHTCERIA